MAKRYTQDQAWRLARSVGATPQEANFLAAVMIPESGGDPNAQGPVTSYGYRAGGLWQIHPPQKGWRNPRTNAKMALSKLRSQGKDAWEAWTKGLVKPYQYGGLTTEVDSPYQMGGGNVARGSDPSPALQPSASPKALFARSMIDQIRSGRPNYMDAIRMLREEPRQPQAVQGPEGPSTANNTASEESLLAFLTSMGLGDAVTSGERSPADNRATGGSPTSYHLPGGPAAYDLNPKDPQTYKIVQHARRNPGYYKEFFYDPLGWYIKNGKIYKGSIGGHGDHIHAAR